MTNITVFLFLHIKAQLTWKVNLYRSAVCVLLVYCNGMCTGVDCGLKWSGIDWDMNRSGPWTRMDCRLDRALEWTAVNHGQEWTGVDHGLEWTVDQSTQWTEEDCKV